MKDIVGLNDDKHTLLANVHTKDQCDGHPCVIHNPTQHHMATWPPQWDDSLGVMWRRCPHLHLHPDPDDVNYLRRVNRYRLAGHMCDGCCQPYNPTPVKEIEAPEPQWRSVEHEPVWRPAQLRYNAAGNTRPGWVCIHELENGMGQCGSNVFRLEDGDSKHSCIVNKGDNRGGSEGSHSGAAT